MENAEKWLREVTPQNGGLVFGGGGAKGCYEIGVWKALEELGIHFGCTAGTSIGALVSAMYVTGSLEQMEEFARTLKPQDIAQDLFEMPDSLGALVSNHKEIGSFLNKYILSRQGMNISPLKDAFEKMFDYSIFEKSPIDYACMTFNLTEKKPEAYFKKQMNEKNSESIILASASCYPAFPVMKMNGQEYIDGGYWDNVPCELAVEMGAQKILAIDVQGPGVTRKPPAGADVLEVRPILPLGNFLDFSAENATRAMAAGYLETRKLAGSACGLIFTFEESSKADRQFWMDAVNFMFDLERIVISSAELEKIARWTTGCSKSGLFDALWIGDDKGQLIESLAYLVGVDPYRIWTYSAFLDELARCLQALKEKYASIKAFAAALQAHELDRQKALFLFKSVITDRPEAARTELAAFGTVYPAELALAWTWYFLEVLNERTFSQRTADAQQA